MPDALGRSHLTNTKRIEMLEKDSEDQSCVLTALVESSKSFAPEQVAQIRAAFREELVDADLRLDDASHQDEAREDFRCLRRLRQAWEGATNKVGTAVLTALVGIALIIFGYGFWQWISNGGK